MPYIDARKLTDKGLQRQLTNMTKWAIPEYPLCVQRKKELEKEMRRRRKDVK